MTPTSPAIMRDPRAFAEAVGDPERLRMLMVLTVADIRAVGPGVWNGWKGQLMRALFEATEALFRGDAVTREDPLTDHPALVERARREGAAVEALPAEGPLESTARVAVAARDRPGLFADLAATLEKRFGRRLNVSVHLEPSLIGGIRVVVGDEVMDTSVKARLEQMRVALAA